MFRKVLDSRLRGSDEDWVEMGCIAPRHLHFLPFSPVDRSHLIISLLLEPSRLSGPHVERRATEKGRGSRLALSEPQASFASRPDIRVAQGSWRSQPRNLGSPSFWLLFLGEARKSTPASKAETQAHSTPHTHQHSTKTSQPAHAAIRWRNKLANDRQIFTESARH